MSGAKEEDKPSLPTTGFTYGNGDDNALAARPQHAVQSKEEAPMNGFLAAPFSGPIRPLSPDTISNLSIEEYEQLRVDRSPSRNAQVRRTPSLPPHPGWRGKANAFWVRNKGLGYMLLAQVFGCLMNVTTRLLEVEGNKGKGLHPFQILFVRMGITFALASSWMWYKKTPHFPLGAPQVRWLLVARGFGGFFGVFGMYYSLLYLPLADATVITFLSPGLACWACSILINEPFTRIEQLAGLVSLVGVTLIARPDTLFAAFSSPNSLPATGNSDAVPVTNSTVPAVGGPDAASYENVTPQERLMAVGIGLIGVMGSATAFTTIRWIGKRAHPLLSVNYFAAWCTIVSIVMQSVLPGVGFMLPADLKEWGYLVFLGTCGFIMQFLLAAGLAYEKSSRATNITYTQMLFALSFDKLIFGHTPDLISIAGSTLILGSAMYVALQGSGATKGKDPQSTTVLSEHRGQRRGDEESQQGLLIGGTADVETGEDHERIPLEELDGRVLR